MSLPPSRSREGPGVGATSADAPRQARPEPLPHAGGASDSGNRPVTLAAIAGAHGITGEVRLKLFGEGWETLKGYRSFNDGALTVAKLRSDNKGGAVARFAEVADRTAAEALRGTVLTVPRSALPPLGEGEYYHADLIGLPAFAENEAGAAATPLGKVVAIDNFGAGDVLEIEKADGKTFLVPMRVEAVPEWDETRVVIAAAFADQ